MTARSCDFDVNVSRWDRIWRVFLLSGNTFVSSHPRQILVSVRLLLQGYSYSAPEGQTWACKEYTPCLLVTFLQWNTSHTFTARSNTARTRAAGCWGPLVAMCRAPSPLYCSESQNTLSLTATGSRNCFTSLTRISFQHIYAWHDTWLKRHRPPSDPRKLTVSVMN